ncbi:MAG: cobalamin-dependent protein [Sulfuricaulis sp.]|uniref:cobalamin-dependent protein n=1 Tax=Sulfuricaulis sp. TaxID=2003553 RepID=UPI003C5041E1
MAVADLCFGRHPLADLRRQVNAFQPDVVGLSIRNIDNAAYPLTVEYLDQHREVVDTLRAVTRAPIILGGSGFAILPEPYMRALDGDWGVAGEDEQAFVELLAALDHGWNPTCIPGVISRRRTSGDTPASATPVRRHLDWAVGLRPADDLFDYPRYIRRGGMGNVQTKRGCVFKCNYCTYPLLEGNRFRARGRRLGGRARSVDGGLWTT